MATCLVVFLVLCDSYCQHGLHFKYHLGYETVGILSLVTILNSISANTERRDVVVFFSQQQRLWHEQISVHKQKMLSTTWWFQYTMTEMARTMIVL